MLRLRRRLRWLGLLQCSSRLALQNSTLKEVRPSFCPEAQGIKENKLAKILLGYKPVFDQLVGLLQHLIHIHNVEMTYIGAEQRLKSSLIRIDARIEGPRIDRIVRFASEVKISREQIADVFRTFDATGRKIVQVLDIAGTGGPKTIKEGTAIESIGEPLYPNCSKSSCMSLQSRLAGLTSSRA